ncbi:amino acid permease [Desulfotomaculum copahuensis]|uniref:amino acid permease n=1 Tax=Desulfotomaculum copahuensis TaxID=1838280 RepID=UPI000AF67045
MSLARNSVAEVAEKESGVLKRALGPLDLTLLGIGAVIGTGIFVLTGVAAAGQAGPAIMLSFVLAAVACVFAALCYGEFSAAMPRAGSVYAFARANMGEPVAWILGWDLILEYGLAVSAVAGGWSGYFQSLLAGFGLHMPVVFRDAPGVAPGSVADLPAAAIVLLLTWLLSRGVKESTRVNNFIVFVKLAVIVLFIAVGIKHIHPVNWHPFWAFGYHGMVAGAATVFFALLGFDAITTAAEEVRRPQRDIPLALVATLSVCTLLYVAVAAVLTGMVPFKLLGVKSPVAFAMQYAGQNWVAGFISLGAIAGITTVILVMLFGLARIVFSISRDGLLPRRLAGVHPRHRTPFSSTWTVGLITALVAGFVPLDTLAPLVNVATLFAFSLVAAGVLVLRYTRPELPRPFRCPGVPVVPLLTAGICLYLIFNLPAIAWYAFGVWMLAGLIIYLVYILRRRTAFRERG